MNGDTLLMVFPEECRNMGQDGKGEWSAEHRIGMEDGDSIREIEGLGFNLCVVPLPKNKGVLNRGDRGGLYFAKVNDNYKLGK